MYSGGQPDIWILKLDAIGNIVWQKEYGDGSWHESYGIQETIDGGYISVGDVLLKLDKNGNIVWQKQCTSCESIYKTSDNAYIIGGYKEAHSGYDEYSWVLKVDDFGNVMWGKTYNGRRGDYERVNSIIQAADGGYVGAGFISKLNTSEFDMFVLKIDPSGEIPECDKIEELNTIGPTTALIAHDTNAIIQSTPVAVINTNTTPKNSSARISAFCCYSNEETDTDGDNIDDVCDNCPNDYNPFQIDCDHDGTGIFVTWIP